MSVTYQTISATANANSSSMTITKPTGTASGDLLIAHISVAQVKASVLPFTLPSGWTQIDADGATTGGPSALSAYKVAGGSEPANYVFGCAASVDWVGEIARFSGQNLTNPIGGHSINVVGTAGTVCTAATITPAANSLLLFLVSTAGGTSQSTLDYAIATDNPTWTEQADAERSTTVSGSFATSTIRAQSTATGAGTSNLNASARNIGILISLPPGDNVTGTAPLYNLTLSQSLVAYAGNTLRLVVSLFNATISKWSNQAQDSTTWTNKDQS